jgi:hypothetical protein
MSWEEGSADADPEADVRAASDQEPDGPADGESGSIGARVDSVLGAAERAAEGIREEAREWARRHKEESQQRAEDVAAGRLRELSSITENLRSSARAVAEECDQLIKAIEEASSRASSDESPPKLRVAGSGSPGDAPISDRARLFAAQMIAAGDSREEISRRLRDEFGIQDASAMLDRMGA